MAESTFKLYSKRRRSRALLAQAGLGVLIVALLFGISYAAVRIIYGQPLLRARAAVSAGADALSLINTLLGMAIDAERRRPQLARGVGGLSGPAVKPVALRMVWEVHQAVDVPLLGMGGISCAIDAVEFMLAGATAVAVGTANFVNPHATVEIIDGMAQYCERHGIEDVQQLIGALEW